MRVRGRLVVVAAVLGVLLSMVPTGIGGAAAEASVPDWSRHLGFTAQGLAVTVSGGIVIAGSSREGYPGGVLILRALRSNGSLAWWTTWGPDGGYARARGVAVAGGRVYASGVVSPEVACDPEIGSFGWFLRAADGRGATRWVRFQHDWDCAWVSGGPVVAGGGVVTIGTTQYIEGYSDIHGVIRAFNTDGRHLWTNPFEPFSVGGPKGFDADDVLAVDARGRTYAAGWAWRHPDSGDHEAALMALDPDGRERWTRVLGEPGRPLDDGDRATDVDVRGARVLLSALIETPRRTVGRVVAFTAAGRRLWTAELPAGTSWWRSGVHVALGAHRTAYAASMRRGVLTVRKFGPGGRVIWTRTSSPRRVLVDIAVGGGHLYELTGDRLVAVPA